MDAGQFFVEMNHKNEKSLKKVLLGAVWTLLDELRCNDAGLYHEPIQLTWILVKICFSFIKQHILNANFWK